MDVFNDKRFSQDKDMYKNMVVPDNIDQFVKAGINIGKINAKRIRIKRLSSLAAAIVLIFACSAIATTPALASQFKNLPGVRYILELINWDRGMNEAFEEGYYQEVGKSETHEGITFSIDKIVADEKNMFVFYKLKNLSGKKLEIAELIFSDEEGKRFEAAMGYNGIMDNEPSKDNVYTGKIDVNFTEEGGKLPARFNLKVYFCSEATQTDESSSMEENNAKPLAVDLKDSNAAGSTSTQYNRIRNKFASVWSFDISLDTAKFFNKIKRYDLNKTLEIERQSITFKSVIVYPTRMIVDIETGAENSKTVFTFENLRLENEKSEVWASVKNGASGFGGFMSSKRSILLQSNYFKEAKELYLKFDSVRALDKDKCKVVLNLSKLIVMELNAPKLKIISLKENTEGYELKYTLNTDQQKDSGTVYNVFYSEFSDEGGKKYNIKSAFSGTGHSGIQEGSIILPKENYSGNITLSLEDYPERIEEDVGIKIR